MEEHLYCYTAEEMAALVNGDTAPESRAVFEKHILECAECRREWIEISLARTLSPEQPAREVQNAIKAAPMHVRRVRARRRAVRTEPSYVGSRVAALIAAAVLVAVVIVLVSSVNTREPGAPATGPSATVPPQEAPGPKKESPEQVVQETEEKEKKVESFPLPGPEKKVEVVQLPEPEEREKVAEPETREEPVKVAEEPKPAPEPERVAEKQPGAHELETEKKEPPRPAVEAPQEKLAFKLGRDDGEIFRKAYRRALVSITAKEQKIIEEARRQAKKFDPIMGRPVQPGGPVTPPAPGTEQPKEEPKQEPKSSPDTPSTLPRIEELRKQGKIPEKGSQKSGESGKNPDAPPPLPRIEELRKQGKIPPAESEKEPKQDSSKKDPKEQPGQGPGQGPKPEAPQMPKPTAPGGPKRGLVQLPEVTPEELKKLAGKAGFEPVPVPGLKKGVLLALAELAEDSADNKVAHLFYYYGKAGFSVFQRKTARTDNKDSYQVFYNGRGKTRTLMWAADGNEFILVAQKLSKREMFAIEASVREFLE